MHEVAMLPVDQLLRFCLCPRALSSTSEELGAMNVSVSFEFWDHVRSNP